MKKRILAFITAFLLLISMQSFAFAATFVNIEISDSSAQYKKDNLSGGVLDFNISGTGFSGANFILKESMLSDFYNDTGIRFYSFTYSDGKGTSLCVKADKNCFMDFNVKKITFKISKNHFSYKYEYTDGKTASPSECVKELTYTFKSDGKYSTHSYGELSGERISCFSSNKNEVVIKTSKVGTISIKKWQFSDVSDSSKWFYRYVNEAGAYGIVGGVGNNMYQPTRNVTRAELATMIVEATKHIISYKEDPSVKFDDVPQNAWYYKFVNMCAAKGLMNGVGEGDFNPTGLATREQIAEVTANFLKLVGGYNGNTLPTINEKTLDSELAKAYKDSKSIHSWAKKSVLLCYKLKVMEGDSGSFFPIRNVTRAESAKIFHDLYFKTIV